MSSLNVPVLEKEKGWCVTMLKETYLEIKGHGKTQSESVGDYVLICTQTCKKMEPKA